MFDQYWEDLHQTHDWLQEVQGGFVEFYEKYYSGQKDLRFLDIGCGTGPNTVFVAEQGNYCIALEASKAAAKKAKEFIDSKGVSDKAHTVVADICEVEFEPESFDCLIDNCTIQTLPLEHAIKAVKKCREWLKPNGRLFSRCATLPYNYSRKEAPVRFTKMEEVSTIYEGLSGEGFMEMALLYNGDQVCHLILHLNKPS